MGEVLDIGFWKRVGKRALNDQITDLAAALAYYSFLAIPAVLLLAIGVFTLVASEEAIRSLMESFSAVVPQATTELLGDSLARMSDNTSGSVVMTVVGFLLALWTSTSAMTAFMRALNRAYDRDEDRGFLAQRAVALKLLGALLFAFVLVFALLVLGPQLTDLISNYVPALQGAIDWIWWVAQWPVLLAGLVAAFSAVLYIGPNLSGRRWRLVGAGAAAATVVWLLVSGLFSLYVANFGSYNKTWGSVATVIIMLTWLWLSGMALLLGAYVNAELRSRRRDRGQDTEEESRRSRGSEEGRGDRLATA